MCSTAKSNRVKDAVNSEPPKRMRRDLPSASCTGNGSSGGCGGPKGSVAVANRAVRRGKLSEIETVKPAGGSD